MRLKVAAAGNAEKNINPIDGRFQAEALRFLRGFDVGILHNTFYSDADPTGEMRDDNPSFNWKIEGKTVDDITVGPGMATKRRFISRRIGQILMGCSIFTLNGISVILTRRSEKSTSTMALIVRKGWRGFGKTICVSTQTEFFG